MNSSFDNAAPNYDSGFTHSVIGRLQRQFVYLHLSKLIGRHSFKSILEVNCGTGEDAVWLAKQHFEVTATDISQKMIDVANQKNVFDDLVFKTLDINKMSGAFADKKFDLIFSNFGGLNCLSQTQLVTFFKNASDLLTEKGKLVLVIMPRHTLWEQFYFLMKRKFDLVARRKKPSVIANVVAEKVVTYYYNPKEILTLAGYFFNFKQQNPIGFFIPPSYLEPFFKNRPRAISMLENWEKNITNYGALAKYADHYLIVFEKK